MLRPLGGKSVTLRNGGVVVGETRVEAGDTLTVGVSKLLISTEPKRVSAPPNASLDLKTLALGDAPGVYVDKVSATGEHAQQIDAVEDLVTLFRLSHSFSEARSRDELEALFLQAVTERLSPRAVWLARTARAEPEVLAEMEGFGTELASQVRHLARETTEALEGALRVEVSQAEAGDEVSALLAAPIIAGGKAIGALAAATRTPHAVYEEADRRFLLAVGRALGPSLVSMAHAEGLELEVERLRAGQANDGRLLGTSRAMAQVRRQLTQAAKSPLSVLICGESGTGKELAAHAVHQKSAFSSGPFVPVNCAAIPGELFESELFGHERGAFTGATDTRAGLVELAKGGTLFLDEIGDLSLGHQARVLRVLEGGDFPPRRGQRRIRGCVPAGCRHEQTHCGPRACGSLPGRPVPPHQRF